MGECGLSLSKCVCIIMQLCFFSFRIFLTPVNFDGLSNISISFYFFLTNSYYYYYLSLFIFFYHIIIIIIVIIIYHIYYYFSISISL